MIIHEDKIDKKMMREYDSKWDEIIQLLRENGFILSAEPNGAVVICKNALALELFRQETQMTESAFIQRQSNLYGIDFRLKETITVYLSNIPERISNARDILIPLKQTNEKQFFINCSDPTNLSCISHLGGDAIDKLIIDMREPMASLAYGLIGDKTEKIIDDREYGLSDSYKKSSEE